MTEQQPRRKPQVIHLDDPDLVIGTETGDRPAGGNRQAGDPAGSVNEPAMARIATRAGVGSRFPWGGVLVAALGLLGSLALSLSFARFITSAVERADWIGWIAFALISIAGVAFLAIAAREIFGLLRLGRLGRLRRELEAALRHRDRHTERRIVEQMLARFAARPELRWPIARVAEQMRNAGDPGDFSRLVDRDVMPVLDGEACRFVAATARRVSVVTALSPVAALTVGWILLENLRLLRALATLYGGQPGFLGTSRLARMVVTHIIATGGVALTDDLLGQFLGQDLMRRLSRRLGESMFNAALTARIGAAAIEVIRPLPYLDARRVRARDFIAEFARWQRDSRSDEAVPGKADP